jgi:hypothetical protein
MASRIEFAVSATPIFSHSGAGEGVAADVIARDVGKSLGGSGSVAASWGTTVGYGNVTAGVADRVSSGANYVPGGADAVTLGTLPASTGFVLIKHSGFLWDAAASDKLGIATLADVKITMAAVIADATTVCVLGPGDAIVLPFTSEDTTPGPFYSGGNAVAIAMEIMAAPRV